MTTRYRIEVTLPEDDPSEVLDEFIHTTGDENVSVEVLDEPTGRIAPLHIWGDRVGVYLHAAAFIDDEEEGTAYYLNADHRPDQPGVNLNRHEVESLIRHASAWLSATEEG